MHAHRERRASGLLQGALEQLWVRGEPGWREADTDYGEAADRYAVIAVAT
ncbi:MAG: hypothetical protein WAK58_19530 [Trebonia sp.]